MGRCGHSATIYNDYLVVFGGIYEITKELNDCFVFDLETRVWTKICSSPSEGDLSNT
jgi:N-acetylneuraminic acid mutarotase